MNEFSMRGLGRIFGRNNRRLRTNEKKQEMQAIVLNSNSTISLRCDFTTALNSIKADCMSADFIDWNSMGQTEIDKLIDEIIKSDYVLSPSSHEFLTTNIKVVLKSLEKDIESIRFVAETAKRHPLVFKHLILNGYHFSDWELKNRHLKYFLDAEVYETTCKVLEIYKDDDKTYIERLNKIIVDFINSKPTIQTFDSIFQYVAEETWRNYRKSHRVDYDNIFGKICAELRSCEDFDAALDNLLFMDKMQEVLGDKYNALYKAMKDYFNIFHSEENNMLEKIAAPKDLIANLSALYVAKCKESKKKKILAPQYDWLKDYFTLKLENPYVNKKIIQYRKKEQFKEAYKNKNKEVKEFIDSLT